MNRRALFHPYSDQAAAIAAAETFTEYYACVQVIDETTGRVIHERTKKPR